MAGHRELLGRPHRMKRWENLDGVAIELHILAALDLNDLALRHAVSPHDIGVGLRADDHGSRLLGNIRGVDDVVPVTMTDQNVVDFLDVLIDHRLIHLDRSPRVELPSEKSRRYTFEIGIDKNRPIAEADFPGVGAEPLKIYACCTGTPTLARRFGAVCETGQQPRSGTRRPSHKASAQDIAPGNVVRMQMMEPISFNEAHYVSPL